MKATRKEQQSEFLKQIKSSFNPCQILQNAKARTLKNVQQQAEFDALWVYEIVGRKYDMIEDPLEMGVFSSHSCYFVVFFKGDSAAIVLWRGKDQDLIGP